MRTDIFLLAGLLACAACGDDNHDSKHAAAEAGVAGSRSAAGALAPVVPSISSIPTVTCAEDVENVTHCGGRECPSLATSAAAALGCAVGCCTADNQCGMGSAAILNGVRVANLCIPVAVPDGRCPTTNLGGINVPGCCDAGGHCGQLYSTTCLSLGTGVRCDAASGDGGD